MIKKYILGNWKLNKVSKDIVNFFDKFNCEINQNYRSNNFNYLVYGFAVSYINLPLAKKLSSNNTLIIAQDVSQNSQGSFTGQVSCNQLIDYQIKSAIIGHSETRKYLGCKDKQVHDKLVLLLQNNMTPIICIGESLKDYQLGKTKIVLKKQIQTIFKKIKSNDAIKCIVAYEPLWAIGSGKTPQFEEISELCSYLRTVFEDIYGHEVANAIPLLYGGSVDENNAIDIIYLKNVNGLLIGKASLDVDKFIKILKDVGQW